MNLEEILTVLNPDIYQRFKTAVELGKWPDGKVLTEEQRLTCTQAMIAYEHAYLPEEQRTGYMPRKRCESGKSNAEPDQTESEQAEPEQMKPLKWQK